MPNAKNIFHYFVIWSLNVCTYVEKKNLWRDLNFEFQVCPWLVDWNWTQTSKTHQWLNWLETTSPFLCLVSLFHQLDPWEIREFEPKNWVGRKSKNRLLGIIGLLWEQLSISGKKNDHVTLQEEGIYFHWKRAFFTPLQNNTNSNVTYRSCPF